VRSRGHPRGPKAASGRRRDSPRPPDESAGRFRRRARRAGDCSLLHGLATAWC